MNQGCFITIAVAVIAACSMQCSPFPDRYERIEPNVIRTNGFVYEPFAEGAPGDTIKVLMHFGGKPIESVSFQMSYSKVMTSSGADTVMDVFDLPECSRSSYLPDSIEVSFVVPESTFFLTKSITQQDIDIVKMLLPPSMQSMTQRDVAEMLSDFGGIDFNDSASLSGFIGQWGAMLGIAGGQSAPLEALLAIGGNLLKFFSVPAVIFANAQAKDGDKLKVKGDFTIRYNRRLAKTPYASLLPVNNPPKIRWFGIYKVRGRSVYSFSPNDTAFAGKYSLIYLYNEMFPDSVRDTVVIDTGYTYFMGADSGMVRYTMPAGARVVDSIRGSETFWHILAADSVVADTSRDRLRVVSAKGRDTVELETFYYDWQYENRDLDSVTMPLDSLFVISPSGNAIAGMLPSIDAKFTHARLWLTVYDYFLGEKNRPAAFAFRQADVRFVYTEPYRKFIKR